MKKDKDKCYGGDWCLKCDEIFPIAKYKKFYPLICKKCAKEIRERLAEMNKNGIYLTKREEPKNVNA